MGNFQHLANKVLSKHCRDIKVSSFLHLGKETGNFQGKLGNNVGNFDHAPHEESQCGAGFKKETDKETNRKQGLLTEETFAAKNNDKSFLINKGKADILDSFFYNAAKLNIDLLPDDKRWLKTVCFGINRPTLVNFSCEYIDRWHKAMEGESVSYKKQNAGRRAANIWLRETLTNQHTS